MDKVTEEILSEFIVCTCQLLPKSYDAVFDSMRIPYEGLLKPIVYIWNCGSTAEFFIRPHFPCIDDIDSLIYYANELAFPEDFPVLPNDLSRLVDAIYCYKIEPYLKYPGFVRLRELGQMNYCYRGKKFHFSRAPFLNRYTQLDLGNIAKNMNSSYIRQKFMCMSTKPKNVRGPAVRCQANPNSVMHDTVHCIWCPQWPREAQGWPKRRRNYGWPTISIISEILRNGCHVVYVQHRSCKDDREQWRFSFSVAEVLLLQSWTKVQQIVYHLLRFFAKRELIQSDCAKEDEVLCTYHLKTLMLWTCEEMSPEWWNSSSVFAICCELLQKLSKWLKKRQCPNYFIPDANLFHESSNVTILEKTDGRINEFPTSGKLCFWFVYNYMDAMVSEIENTIKVKPDFMGHVIRLIEFRNFNTAISLDFLFSCGYIACHLCACVIFKYEFKLGLSTCLFSACFERKFGAIMHKPMSILPLLENDLCFTYFDKALYSLHTTYVLSCGNMPWDSELFVEYVKGIFLKPKIVRCQYNKFPEPLTAERSQCQYFRAQDMMVNLTGSNSLSEYQLLSLLSRELLRKALRCKDSKSNSIAAAALVYLAALHFAASEHQIVIDLCSTVLMSQATILENETLNAGCLFFIDGVVRIVGLCLLCKKFSENLHYSQKHIFLDLRLTPKVFAYYLTVISAEGISKQLNFDLPTSTCPLDQFLLVLTKPKFCTSMKSCIYSNAVTDCACDRMASSMANEPSSVNRLIVKGTIIDILTEYAFENMTIFYSLIYKEFDIQCNTVDCYRALYLYKCRQYDDVLHLCERILHEPDLQSDLKEFAFANILVMPPLDAYFDRDVQSLLGFHTMLHYLLPLNDELLKSDLSVKSTFAHCFARIVYYLKNPLSHLLDGSYSMKCHYFVGRHFLAKYLKLRCRIDCNLPFAEAMAEFIAMKNNFPFERIIRQFLLQKLRETHN